MTRFTYIYDDEDVQGPWVLMCEECTKEGYAPPASEIAWVSQEDASNARCACCGATNTKLTKDDLDLTREDKSILYGDKPHYMIDDKSDSLAGYIAIEKGISIVQAATQLIENRDLHDDLFSY